MAPLSGSRSQPAAAGVVQGSFPGGRPVGPPAHTAGIVQAWRLGGGAAPARVILPARPLGGQRLPEAVQRKMEALLGADLSAVRVHVGPEAAALGASAFTHGPNVYFAPGLYAPATPQGQRLLAHELTHVVQQRSGRVRNPFGTGLAVVQDPILEAEAERMALRALSSGPLQPKAAPTQPGRPARLVARPPRSIQPSLRIHLRRDPPALLRSVRPQARQAGGRTPVLQCDVVRVFSRAIPIADPDTALAMRLQIQALIESLDPIMEEAVSAVDNGTGLTDATAAYMRDRGSRAAAAKRGTAIHEECYVLIKAAVAQLNGSLAVITERSVAVPPHFPNRIEGGRPDVRIALGGGFEALLDITSAREAERRHTASREWGENNDHVLFVGEMPYGGED